MSHRLFDPPVFVRDGKYLIQEIIGLSDAIDLLEDWPDDRRDLIHETVLKACYAALDGHKPLSTARSAFVRFANTAGILEEPTRVMPRTPPSTPRDSRSPV